jgi:hypothetical protein
MQINIYTSVCKSLKTDFDGKTKYLGTNGKLKCLLQSRCLILNAPEHCKVNKDYYEIALIRCYKNQ